MSFKDFFSGHAVAYAAARPRYPERLFDFLAELAPGRRRAFDCGAGNGQATLALARHFDHVIAGDPSAMQLASAPRRAGIDFVVATAEHCPVGDHSMELVTVAQALHWFDVGAFFREARRVLVPEGVLAVWCYNLLSVEPEIDRLIRTLYAETLGADWSPERRLVDDEYRSIDFPFDEVSAPALTIELEWSLAQLAAYLRTWSACVRYRERVGTDPVDALVEHARGRWGDPERARRVRWPIHMRVGRVR
jgi:SAM-dependent methyltransferase